MKTVFVGFDSAWAGNPSVPGAICAISFDGKKFGSFRRPRLVGFDDARRFIANVSRAHRLTLIAIDQPTIVENDDGMRPAEKVAASAISWLGGGVQPAFRNRKEMFGDGAPIWKFLCEVRAKDNPEQSQRAKRGRFIMEVFPALALPSMNPSFCGRRKAPKYNPERSTFQADDWKAVIVTVLKEAQKLGCNKFVAWCQKLKKVIKPSKRHQDKLDAAICLLIAIRWRMGKRKDAIMIGDLKSGYIVAPVTPEIKTRLRKAAVQRSVTIDGSIPR